MKIPIVRWSKMRIELNGQSSSTSQSESRPWHHCAPRWQPEPFVTKPPICFRPKQDFLKMFLFFFVDLWSNAVQSVVLICSKWKTTFYGRADQIETKILGNSHAETFKQLPEIVNDFFQMDYLFLILCCVIECYRI